MRRGRTLRSIVILCLTGAMALGVAGRPAAAGVNLKNGNFYISYTDLIVGDRELMITRTYNSKASARLMFGVGWGSDFETRLEVVGDGSVVIQENGSGLRREYRPLAQSGQELESMLDRMMDALERDGWLASDEMRARTRQKLASDAEARQSMQRRLIEQGLIAPTQIAPGEELLNPFTQGSVVTREPGGYYRRSSAGYERFSLDGQLIESRLEGKPGFRLRYDPDGHLRAIVSQDGDVIRAETDAEGLVTLLESDGGASSYSYDARGRLTMNRNVADTVFRYEYDDRSNMTAILYEDGGAMRIGYDDRQFVSEIVARDGETTRYDYGDLPRPGPEVIESYYTEVSTFPSPEATDPSGLERQEYEISMDRFGNRYTSRHLLRRNGQERETRQHACGLPTLQRQGDRQTEYDYDDQCRLTMKRQQGRESRITYDPRSDKIASVTQIDLSDGSETRSDFGYDYRANLVTARDSRGRSVVLTYDGKGEIQKITDQDGQELSFVYNERGKPVEITLAGLGSIQVAYDEDGEIANVESDGGADIALQVTRTFQTLLSLIQPAGVDFNM